MSKHQKVKKLQEEYIAKQNMKPRDLVSVQEMAQSPQKVNRYQKKQQELQKDIPVVYRTAKSVRQVLTRPFEVIGIYPGAPSHIF